MECAVYRLRRFGERLPNEVIEERPTVGRLRVVNIPGTSQLRAELFDLKRKVQVDEIRSINVVKIDHGILIAGCESLPGRGATKQTWWCVPLTEELVRDRAATT